jgi:hypothetical protein
MQPSGVEKFVDHFLWIAAGMNGSGEDGMWDEEDGFYYDMLVLPDGRTTWLKVHSLVGLLPLCARTTMTICSRRLRVRRPRPTTAAWAIAAPITRSAATAIGPIGLDVVRAVEIDRIDVAARYKLLQVDNL